MSAHLASAPRSPRLLELADAGYGRPGDPADNWLIHGDNLPALDALADELTGRVRCIYIDPPFNTGQSMEHYHDALDQDRWLAFMRLRLERLHRLLADDGTLAVHLDDNQLAYLTVVLDQIFGRDNRASLVTFKQSSVSGPKSVNTGLVTIANYILIYAKDKSRWRPNRIFVARSRDKRYNQYLARADGPPEAWRFCTLREELARRTGCDVRALRRTLGDELEAALEQLVLDDPSRVVRLARVKDKDVNQDARRALAASRATADRVFHSPRDDRPDYYFMNGQQLLFYSAKAVRIDGRWVTGAPASNIWDDLLSNNLHNEGGVRFPKGKKPEALLKRIIELATDPGDWVLDAFAGSGTTGAVAHKTGRRWIMIEQGDQLHSHIRPRLARVIDGDDASGVTAATDWRGGGGYRCFAVQ